MQEAKIKFDHVTKVFETRSQTITAVKDYSMEIQAGEFVSILGPSGCGKSTLIRMLDGIIDTTEGDILIDGVKVNHKGKKMPREVLRKLGFIFQQPNMLPWYTVRQNVALPLQVFGLKGPEWDRRVDDLLKMVGLQDYADAHPSEISGGMLQRAGVIRAMVHDPEILLMDEPFGALDAQTRTQLQTELLRTWEEEQKTCFFITHDVEEAILLASRVVVMSARPGRIKDVIDIDIPYPRNQETKMLPRFTELKNYIWGMVYKEYLEVQK